MAKVLVVDDDPMILETLAERIIGMGHTVRTANTLKGGMAIAESDPVEVVFLDVRLPDGDGLAALPDMRNTPSQPEVIIITGLGDIEGAEMAIKSGAWDYIQKPFSRKEIMLQLVRALEYREKKSGAAPPVSLKRPDIIGDSPALNASLDLLAQAVHGDANVLLTGATGTGKELFARAIHENSARSKNTFIVVDCTVLPEKLVESVLFGHVKGAFTGAEQNRDGLVQQADGGTLFLDEVGELPLKIQKAFLRVLQERRFRPVGGKNEIRSDFRLISATNRDLETMVAEGLFREDLLFRLRTFAIELPNLAERKSDIKAIVMHHIARICEANGMETKGFSPEFLSLLTSYDWPGNVRELLATLEKAIFADPGNPILYPMHLPNHIRLTHLKSTLQDSRGEGGGAPAGGPGDDLAILSDPTAPLPPLKEYRDMAVERAEQGYLKRLMAATDGSISRACSVSGLSRARLYSLMKKHNVSRGDRSDLA